jgi:hypothetical protein
MEKDSYPISKISTGRTSVVRDSSDADFSKKQPASEKIKSSCHTISTTQTTKPTFSCQLAISNANQEPTSSAHNILQFSTKNFANNSPKAHLTKSTKIIEVDPSTSLLAKAQKKIFDYPEKNIFNGAKPNFCELSMKVTKREILIKEMKLKEVEARALKAKKEKDWKAKWDNKNITTRLYCGKNILRYDEEEGPQVANQISKRRESGDSHSLEVSGKKERQVIDADFEISPSSEMKLRIKTGYWCPPIKNFDQKPYGAIPQPTGSKFLNEKITNRIYGNGDPLADEPSGHFYEPPTIFPKESLTTDILPMKPSIENDRHQSHMSSFVGALSRIEMFTNSSCASSNFCSQKISPPKINNSPNPKPDLPTSENNENFNSIDSFLVHERNNLSDPDSMSRVEFYGYPKIMVEGSDLIIDNEDSESERKEAPCEPRPMSPGGGGE